MRRWVWVLLCGMAASKVGAADAVSDRLEGVRAEEVALFDIPDMLRAIKDEAAQLQSEMAQLPVLEPPLPSDGFGYHGGYLPALEELPDEPRWTVDVTFRGGLHQVILVPAIDRRFQMDHSYGFPRRFRLSQILPDGSTRVVKEWMDEDCPDPGRNPLVIDLPKPWQTRFRIEVFRGATEEGNEFFALDEFFGIATDEVFLAEKIEVDREYESLPYWSKHFLIDRKTSLGLPVSADVDEGVQAARGDYEVEFEQAPSDPCIIELDLGRNRRFGWVTLYPATPPEGIIIPGYGFPEKIELEIVREGKNDRRVTPKLLQHVYEVSPGNNVVRMAGYGKWGRWVRLKVSGFPVHNGRRVFSMGEIHLNKAGETYPVQQVRLLGFPEGAEKEAALLVDRRSNGKPVMPLVDWLRELRVREDLATRLQARLVLADALDLRWKRFKEAGWKIAGMLFVAVALLVAIISVILRYRSIKRLRWQMTRDLHDQVGSSLGSISLATETMGIQAKDPEVKSELEELGLMARDAYASLREVVWFNDTGTIRLPMLLQQLAERAERTLRGVEIAKEFPAHIPDEMVSLTFKRHVTMFFREVVYNAARHAQASKVWLKVSIDCKMLSITVTDNGRGFDPDALSGGWGLESLRRRAKEMGGEMELSSSPGQGTSIRLFVSLKFLPRDPRPAYKTSN